MSSLLADFTSLRLGGPAARMVEGRSEAEIIAAVDAADASGEALLILGGGSNLVVADEGFPGTVLLVRNRGVEFGAAGTGDAAAETTGTAASAAAGTGDAASETTGTAASADQATVTAAAGETWDELVAASVEHGLAGFECLSGIPGSAGATPIQNVGAYGQEVADTIASVRAYDRREKNIVEMSPAECEFGYRDSVFKRNPGRWVVLTVRFRLIPSADSLPIRYAELAGRLGVSTGERAPLNVVRETVLGLRRGKGLLAEAGDPEGATAGSFFTNPVLTAEAAERLRERAGNLAPPLYPQADGTHKTSAAWLIQNSGFAPGYGDPAGIAISSRHCLVLTNRGGGDTAGLLRLAHEIAAAVRQRFGVELRPEPILIGAEW